MSFDAEDILEEFAEATSAGHERFDRAGFRFDSCTSRSPLWWARLRADPVRHAAYLLRLRNRERARAVDPNWRAKRNAKAMATYHRNRVAVNALRRAKRAAAKRAGDR